ncbi:hypothetical protein J6590_067941 [Homalodisca vitripennis]|nr:hypothetical protein J6590_067941 [Homalodisca vitripennis]
MESERLLRQTHYTSFTRVVFHECVSHASVPRPVDSVARRILVSSGNQTTGQLFRHEIRPGEYRAAHSGVSAPYYGSTQHPLELR